MKNGFVWFLGGFCHKNQPPVINFSKAIVAFNMKYTFLLCNFL